MRKKKSSLYRSFLYLLGIFVLFQIVLVLWHHSDSPQAAPAALMTSSSSSSSSSSKSVQQPLADDWICSQSPRGFSPAVAWQKLHSQGLLLQALHHPRDGQNVHTNWTADLLNLLTPHILQYSIKGYPQRDILRSVVAKLSLRSKSLVETNGNRDLSHIPPLKIVVFGGSIVEGTGCMRSPIPGGKLDFESLQECAWPFRLEKALNFLVDQFVSKRNVPSSTTSPRKWIEVHNLAAGGTNSEAAIPILRYWLSPVLEPNGADVVVNAYCANDNLSPAFHATTNTTVDSFHLARILQRNMQFVQAARFSNLHHVTKECQRTIPGSKLPTILYVNDYLGNQQESIVGEGQLDQAVQWLTDVEPTMGYVSVAHSVRRWVLADTSEDFFSAPWVDRKGNPIVNVHYGMAGHVTTTIGILYYMLQLLLDYCEEAVWSKRDDAALSSKNTPTKLWNFPEDYVQIEIPSKEWVQEHQPSIIHPNITETDWRHWGKAPNSQKCYHEQTSQSSKAAKSPCAFAFLAAPLGTHQQQDSLSSFLEPFTLQNEDWAVQNDFRQGGFQNKLGLVANRPGATMTLAVDAAEDPSRIRVVTIHYLKSYGDLWKESRVEFRAQILSRDGSKIDHEQVWELEGFHEQAVSISYFHNLKLQQEVPKDGSFRLQMKLVGGRTFKMNALMFCSQ